MNCIVDTVSLSVYIFYIVLSNKMKMTSIAIHKGCTHMPVSRIYRVHVVTLYGVSSFSNGMISGNTLELFELVNLPDLIRLYNRTYLEKRVFHQFCNF